MVAGVRMGLYETDEREANRATWALKKRLARYVSGIYQATLVAN